MGMTVAELIKLLEGYPPILRVVVDGYEEGYDDLSPDRMLVTGMRPDTKQASWQGMHGEAEVPDEGGADTSGTVAAPVLRRASR